MRDVNNGTWVGAILRSFIVVIIILSMEKKSFYLFFVVCVEYCIKQNNTICGI